MKLRGKSGVTVVGHAPAFIEPVAMPKLHDALRSAACYAELARLAGDWEANNIERKIYDRDLDKPDNGRLRGTFFNLRNGGKMHEKNVAVIQSRFPSCRLRLCWEHPIGQILTNPKIGIDRVLEILKAIPSTPVRDCIFSDAHTILTWNPAVIEIPDSQNRIAMLEKMATPYSLLALIGRMRLAQLREESKFERLYEQAIYRTLPQCIASSTHLYLGQSALLEAIDLFTKWHPYSESRVLMRVEADIGLGHVRDQLQEAVVNAQKPAEFYPPDTQLRKRAKKVEQIMKEAELFAC